MTGDDENLLSSLFAQYREACPEPEPGPDFMPVLWGKIEARHNFWPVFWHFGRIAAPACAALCLLLLLLNFSVGSEALGAPSYTDALAADHTAEKLYYAEGIRESATAVDYQSADANGRR